MEEDNKDSLAKLKPRNISIDCMRLLAMLMIGLAHSTFCSGFTGVSPDHSIQRGVMSLFVSFSQFPVSLFALISGYVCVSSQWKISRWLLLWIQVAFYVILLYFISGIFLSGEGWLYWGKQIAKGILPHKGAYWYFNAYTYLFFLIPLLNAGLNSIPRKIVLLCILLFSFCCLTGEETYYGYTCLMLMYLIGGYLRLYPIEIKPIYCLVSSFVCVLLTACFTYHNRFGLVYSHAFPPTIILTISLFLFFINKKFHSHRFIKTINILAPFPFGCYLLQCHPIFFNIILKDWYHRLAKDNPIPWVIGMTVALFLCGLAVDALRQRLFLILRIRKWIDAVNKILD